MTRRAWLPPPLEAGPRPAGVPEKGLFPRRRIMDPAGAEGQGSGSAGPGSRRRSRRVRDPAGSR